MTANQLVGLNLITAKLKRKRFTITQLNDEELKLLERFLSSDFQAFFGWLQGVKDARDAKRKKAELPTPLTSITETGLTPTTPERKAAVEQLYLTNYKTIIAACLVDEEIIPDDACLIFGDLETSLDRYTGELTPDAFLEWALEAIKPLVAFYAMRREHGRAVYAGAWSIVRSAIDLGFDETTIPDIEADVWRWVLFGTDSPLIPNSGKGKVSTRLYGKARWLARAWKTRQLRAKEKHVGVDEAVQLETADNQRKI